MGTQSYRPWGERLLSKHKLFLIQEGPAFSIATPSQILFSLFKSSKGYRGYMFGVQRPWPVVYWWLACLGRSAGQSSNHNFIIFTPPFDLNGGNQKFSAAIVLPLESWTVCYALAYSSWALRSLRLFHIINIPSWTRHAGKLLLLGDSLGNHTER